MTKLEITKRLQKYFPKLEVSFKDKGHDPRNYRVNFSKVKSVLDFEPRYTIDDGIKEVIAALKKGKFLDLYKYSDNLGNYKINNELII